MSNDFGNDDFSQPLFAREGDFFVPAPFTNGPWDPSLMHGGPPSCLMAWAAEQIPTPAPMAIARMSIDLMRPGPIAPFSLRTAIEREGRNIQLVEVRLSAKGQDFARASILKIRLAETDSVLAAATPPPDLPSPEECPSVAGFAIGFGANFDIRLARGQWRAPVPTACWFRLRRPVFADIPASPAMLAAAAADFGSGVSGVIDFQYWTYINADLSIALTRAPEGEWLLLDVETWASGEGRGLATARLGDKRGYFGRTLQNLVVAKR
ncbi:MAG: thioesterase family protein [Hyphomonadaceae bacterium]